MIEVKNVKYYSVVFDETTDESNSSQITLNIHYIYKNQVHERFIGFIDIHKCIFDKKKEELTETDYEDEDKYERDHDDQRFEPKISGGNIRKYSGINIIRFWI